MRKKPRAGFSLHGSERTEREIFFNLQYYSLDKAQITFTAKCCEPISKC
jgi:transcriptional antiterminator